MIGVTERVNWTVVFSQRINEGVLVERSGSSALPSRSITMEKPEHGSGETALEEV
jgi:hypothetical protein